MVLMGMGADDGVQLFHTLVLQVGDYQIAVVHIAAVDDHVFTAAFHKRAVRLAHIDEVDGQGIGLGGRLLPVREGDKGIQQAAAGQQQAKAQQPGDELFHLRPSTVSP